MAKDELMKKAYDSIIDSDEDAALAIISEAEGEGVDLLDLLTNGFGEGIKFLGEQFGSGDVFLPELIFASEVMKSVSTVIEEKLGGDVGADKKCTMVIGTVEGDVHDIGKGIVASLVKSNGAEVYDLGREVPAAEFIKKAKEVDADIIGSSALLTTTMTVQKDIQEMVKKENLDVVTMVGGAPVTQRWADRIGADFYCEDAAESVTKINEQFNK